MLGYPAVVPGTDVPKLIMQSCLWPLISGIVRNVFAAPDGLLAVLALAKTSRVKSAVVGDPSPASRPRCDRSSGLSNSTFTTPSRRTPSDESVSFLSRWPP